MKAETRPSFNVSPRDDAVSEGNVMISERMLRIQPRRARRSRPASLVRGTLTCRLCGRSPGEVIGKADRPVAEARFFPSRVSGPPVQRGGTLHCRHCAGTLYLDAVEHLAQSVELSEVGGLSFARVLALTERSKGAGAQKRPSGAALRP